MEFGFMLFLLSAALFEHSAGSTTSHYSCRYNCGYNFGSCSCTSSCQYYGNCCQDYYDYCSITATTTNSPTTARYSCRYHCGYTYGSCSCTSSCQYYGNCCHDYYDYCSSTAATTNSPTSAQYSCRYNCGYNFGSCSCTSSCRYYGNCCRDYYDYCSSTAATTNSPTTAQYSCRYNCGYNFGSCSCTSSCRYYGNCCRNYYDYCSSTTATTNSPTTAQHSCRYHCGYHFGSCSCTSSCRYYGNCCHDYYDYCSSTAATTNSPTSAPYSCRYNCGYNFGSCSCTSSCQYYGNCCRDYYDYCSITATTTNSPTSACGGRLHGSGSISSPYYPGYYHNNAYCEWQLSAPAGQTIFLSFQDLDLERCCSCDYVKVYDGLSAGSPLLGMICHNNVTHLEFQSSLSYMTVLFRSDHSGVGRGFKASFSSSLNSNTGRVDCSSEKMNIVIRKSYLDSLGFNWQDLYLDDRRCRPSADYYYVTFNFPLHSCSTRRNTENGRIIYTNNVRAAQSTSGEITRYDTTFQMVVRCVMERDSSVGTLYQAQVTTNGTISGTGRFNTTMAFYPSSSFSYPITESPYKVNLNQQLYAQVQLTRPDPSLHLFIDTCVASPNHDFSSRTYDLIRNGCRKDNTVSIYRNGDHYYAQFGFRAFKFLRTHSQVFLRCDVIICADNDYNSRCRQGCRYRKKRSLSSDHHTEVVTLGPITLKGPEEAVTKVEDKK